jgi:hypothetical protein
MPAMKNKLSDLNNHLFAQLERLGDEEMTPAQIESEVQRSAAVVEVAEQVVKNADIQLKAAKLYGEFGNQVMPMLPAIGYSE